MNPAQIFFGFVPVRLGYFIGSGAAPRCFSVSPIFPLAPRAPSLVELAGDYPLSRREPTFQSFQVSISAKDWGEYGESLVLVLVRCFLGVFGLGGSLSGGFGPRPLFFI